MKNTTPTTPPFIYIEKVENLHIDKVEPPTATHIYIEKVENLHIGKVGLTAASASYHQQPSAPAEQSTMPTLDNSKLALATYCVLES
jgi:hypothetical protein